MQRISIYIFLLLIFYCFNLFSQVKTGEKEWRGELKLNDSTLLPFNFIYNGKEFIFLNASERIISESLFVNGDSAFIQMPVYDSEFRIHLKADSMSGIFINHARTSQNVIQFNAVNSNSRFFNNTLSAVKDFSGRYSVIFASEDEDSREAVGIFEMKKNNLNYVQGTFLTTTGDYRFLEGQVNGDRLYLSAFDGAHLFLFTARIKNDSLIDGHFYSGQHWHDTWVGVKNNSAELKSADSLIVVKSDSAKFNFVFPDENGNIISSNDNRFKNKSLIIQIMGTWCPNCLDETKFLSEWYKTKPENIEVIALDFEKINDSTTANKNIRRLKKAINISYPILFAGSADKKEAAKQLPQLNRLFAFPTTIFINKSGRVIKVHTGFSGPATGKDFSEFRNYFSHLVDQLN